MLNSEPEVGGTEGIGVLVASIVLVVTFGSLVAAGMTMLNALIGVGVGMAGLFALSGAVELTSTAPILALMLGLAVGIDYSLFITSRHRQQLRRGLDPEEAVARAVGTAGSAVVFAGATVVIALAGLAVVGIPFLTVMGLAAAGTVAVAVLVAITLLPALLGFAGQRVLPRKLRGEPRATEAPARRRQAPRASAFRWARFVTRLRVPVILVGVLGLGAARPAGPGHAARAARTPAPRAVGTPARKAADLIREGFGPGFNGRSPLVVTVGLARRTTATAVPQVAGADQGTDGRAGGGPAAARAGRPDRAARA